MSQATPLKPPNIKKAQKAALAAKVGTHDPFARINALPPEKYELVVNMLKAGHSPYQVAKVVQSDWEQCLDVTEITFAHQLERFRSATIPIDQIVNPYMVAKLMESARRNVNVISEQSALIEMQQERLRQSRLQEIESGTLTPLVDKQVVLLNRLLKNYGDTAIKCGLINHYVHEFKKFHEEENEDITFTMEKLYFSTFKKMHSADPENFIDNLYQMLMEANS